MPDPHPARIARHQHGDSSESIMSDSSFQTQMTSAENESDPLETAEWRESLRSLYAVAGPRRAREILDMLAVEARSPEIGWQPALPVFVT